MRTMSLPELPGQPPSLDACVKIYLERLPADNALWPDASLLLTAYMAWPDDETRRDGFLATFLAKSKSCVAGSESEKSAETPERITFEKFGGVSAVAKPAFERLTEEVGQMQRRWLWVADIFQMIVDTAYEDRIALRRGSSISKAIDLCEIENGLPGHSQLRKAWSGFRDVAHLIAAGAYLAHRGLADAGSAPEASILKAVWIAPDAVLALAAGLQQFGLQRRATGESPILQPDMLWRIPAGLVPEKPFIVFRHLTETQLAFLSARRAPKKYVPTARS
jgi:hypothetical protein